MATRLIGTDDGNPRLPVVVIAATQGYTAADLAPGDVLADANAYTDSAIADIVAGGVAFASDAETIAGTLDTKAVTPAGLKASRHYVDVRTFGALGDGVADDTVAIQNAIDFCLGGTPTAGASATRNAVCALYLPKGNYKLTGGPLRIISVLGFEMFGDGYQTQIRYVGTQTYGIEMNGISRCYFHDFTVTQHSAADTATYAVGINWDPAIAQRTTSINAFDRLYVGGKYVYGIAAGHQSADRQVDSLCFTNCIVTGGRTIASAEATWWQAGFKSGSGVHGNILNHTYIDCESSFHRWNVWNDTTNVHWRAGAVGTGESDFRHSGARYFTIDGCRSEGSQRLFIQDGNASFHSMASISNVLFMAQGLHSDGRLIRVGYSGPITLTNIEVATAPVAVKIHFEQSGPPARPAQMTATGLKTESLVTDLFTSGGVNAQAAIVVSGYTQTNAVGQAIGFVPMWVKGLQTVSNVVVEDVEIDGAINHDGNLAGFFGATPVAKPTGVTAATALSTLGLATATEAYPYITAAPPLTTKVGEYWGPPFPRTTTALVAGNIYSFAVYVPAAMTLVRIGAEITVLAAGSTLTLGVYDDDGNGDPGTLLFDAGTVDGGVVGAVEKTISQPLPPGRLVHFATLCQGGTPTVRVVNTGWSGRNNTLVNALTGATRGGRANSGVVGTALPATFPAPHSPFTNIPAVAVRL